MSDFNLSARRDDMSLRLRAKNMKHAREQTKRLEQDNHKMEERLNELKTAMTREKEERERQGGGGFWGRGQSAAGSLTHYATEVLHSKAKTQKVEKKKKLRVLQDEPLDLPKRSSQPGTMKYIAQRKLTSGATPRDKLKGPRCGQCEDRTASLSCVQCSEIYCPGCFAAFHLKGALKQHRSVPISASRPRVCMSPRSSGDASSPRGSQASGDGLSPAHFSSNGSEASGPSSARSREEDNSLLVGDYNESQSAASFQQALMAWRHGEEASDTRSPQQVSPHKSIASPVKSPVMAVDESTGMPEQANVPDIKFTANLSYAERLMLKKHRRTELAETNTPRLSIQSESASRFRKSDKEAESDRIESYAGSGMQFGPQSSVTMRGDFDDSLRNQRQESFIDDDQRVDFQSLYDAVAYSESSELKSRQSASSSESCVSVMDPHMDVMWDTVTSSIQIQNTSITNVPLPTSSTTHFMEDVSPSEPWKIQTQPMKRASSTTFIVEQPQRSQVSYMESLSVGQTNTISLDNDRRTPLSNLSSYQESRKKTYICHQPSEIVDGDEDSSSVISKSFTQYSGKNTPESGCAVVEEGAVSEKVDKKQTKSASRPKSSKSRPPSSVGKSGKSRPGSRTQSRASSRLRGEGLLTKAPSDELHRIAHLVPEADFTYQSPMEGFFLVGVDGEDAVSNENRVMTPSQSRVTASRPKSRTGAKSAVGDREAIKVSNKLYQMAPRSWRPDSSLGDTVPLNEVKVDDPGEEAILSYSYSGQMSGRATKWLPSSSHSRMEMPSDNLGLNTSLVFGDEMFTALAAATPTPRPSSSHRSDRTMHEAAQSASAVQTRRKSANRRLPEATTPGSSHTASLSSSSQGMDLTCVERSHTPVLDRLRRKNELRRRNDSNIDGEVSQSKSPSMDREKEVKPLHSQEVSALSKTQRSSKISESHRITSSRAGTRDSGNTENVHKLEEESTVNPSSSSQRSVRSRSGKPEFGVTAQANRGHHAADLQRMKSEHDMDATTQRRPVSSTNMPAVTQSSEQKQNAARPNSSIGGIEPSRKPQSISQSLNTGPPCQDSIVADVMMSRVQADGWINDEDDANNGGNGNKDDSVSSDFGLTTPRAMQSHGSSKSNIKNSSSHWETDVRPFSGLSIDSKPGDLSPLGKRGERKDYGCEVSRPASTWSSVDGRESRGIVMDGEDLSQYDEFGAKDEQNVEDKQALDKLEWELASDTGRLTADGQISRMSIIDNDDAVVSSSSSRSSTRSLRMSADREYDVSAKLREDEMLAEQDIDECYTRRSVALDEDEVRALR